MKGIKTIWLKCAKCGVVDRSYENQNEFHVGTKTSMKCPDCGGENGLVTRCRECCPTGHSTHPEDERWKKAVKESRERSLSPEQTEEQADLQVIKAWSLINEAETILARIDNPIVSSQIKTTLTHIKLARSFVLVHSKQALVVDLKKRPTLEYLDDVDSVETIKDILNHKADFFSSFFIAMKGDEVEECWGVKGILRDWVTAIRIK